MGNGYYLIKVLKRFLLFLSLGAFVLSLFSVLKHWQFQESFVDITKTLRIHVNDSDIASEIDQSIENSEFDDARMYLDIARSNLYKLDYAKYESEIKRKDTSFTKVKTQVSSFAKGFAKGESSDMAGLVGAVSADFTVVGDVRDLRKQYSHYSDGEDVNELIALLSGVGVGLTAITVVSLGSAAPVKAGASIMKVAVKTNRLTSRFQKQVVKLGRNVFNWTTFVRLSKQDTSFRNIRVAAKQAYKPRAVEPLKKIATQVNAIRKSTSSMDTIQLLKYVETTDDLRHLEKVSLKHGTKTKGLMKLVGKGSIRTVRVLRKSTELILSVVSTFLSGLFSLLLFSLRKPNFI